MVDYCVKLVCVGSFSSFRGVGVDLFSFAHQLGVPSVFSIEDKVLTRYGVDLLLVEIANLISSLCPDVKPRIYRETPR